MSPYLVANELRCPGCEGTSFTLSITGHQEHASFVQSDESGPVIYRAEAVTVTDHDPEFIRCEGCGAELTEDDLEPRPQTRHDLYSAQGGAD